jgi:hypothetical protein
MISELVLLAMQEAGSLARTEKDPKRAFVLRRITEILTPVWTAAAQREAEPRYEPFTVIEGGKGLGGPMGQPAESR